MASFPASIYSPDTPEGTSLLATIDHALQHSGANGELIVIEQKVGLGAGTPTLNKVLIGSGNGTSIWGTVWDNPTFGTPAITSGTLTNPTINTGTINTSLFTGGTVSGGTLNDGVINRPVIQGFYSVPQSTTVAAGGTATLDLNLSNEWRVVFGTGNLTLAISNAIDGKKFIVSLTQDAVGTRTATWFSTIRWPENTAPTLTTTANKRDTFGFICTGTATYDGFIVGQNS